MNNNCFLRREYDAYRALLRKVPSLALTLLVLSVVSMNLLANKELFKTSWIALDCGFALSWLPFLIMDCVCKVFGGKDATRLSILALAINLAFFALFKLIALTPGMWGEYYSTGMSEVNESLNRTIGGSSWIVFGSALAMLVASVINSAINISIGGLMHRDNYRTFAVRSFTSTLISQFADNLVFALVVTMPLFGWSIRQSLVCATTCAFVEMLMEVCFSGIGYKICKTWKE